MTKYVLSIRRGADGDVALGHGRSCDLGHNGGTGEEGGHGGLGVRREGGAGKNNNLTWPLDEKKLWATWKSHVDKSEKMTSVVPTPPTDTHYAPVPNIRGSRDFSTHRAHDRCALDRVVRCPGPRRAVD